METVKNVLNKLHGKLILGVTAPILNDSGGFRVYSEFNIWNSFNPHSPSPQIESFNRIERLLTQTLQLLVKAKKLPRQRNLRPASSTL
jgi:hypothetical protein